MTYIAAVGAVNSLGKEMTEISHNLALSYNARHHLVERSGWLLHDKQAWFGEASQQLACIPKQLAKFNSRNNQLIYTAYLQIEHAVDLAIKQFGKQKIAIIMGTSTSGIHEGDLAVKQHLQSNTLPNGYFYNQQELGDPASFLATLLDLKGPAYTISTACTSSARAIISGKRLIESGLVDAAIVGGADSFSRMPINGFLALESMSDKPCMPFAQARDGINIGEAGALFLLTKNASGDIAILGTGESSDAYHISAPHPQGIGAEKAMVNALQDAKLTPNDIGYINLHGTATPLNDQAESAAVYRVFHDSNAVCSSTKHLTGHTLGTAAATELAISYILMTQKIALPQQDFSLSPYDPNLAGIAMVTQKMILEQPIIMSNSFAFGGNNASLIIGKHK